MLEVARAVAHVHSRRPLPCQYVSGRGRKQGSRGVLGGEGKKGAGKGQREGGKYAGRIPPFFTPL